MYFEDVSQSVMRELARIHRGINCEGASCKGGAHDADCRPFVSVRIGRGGDI